MDGLIELDALDVAFAGRPILKGLTAQLSGRAVGLLGPNGAGKTTLLHTLLGFHPPRAGRARLLGHDVVRETREIRRITGYMPENESFVGGMSAVRYVRMMAELSGLPTAEALERAHESLFYVGLGEARYRRIETYSLGMRQLAKLAQAIAHGPQLLILDEPTNGLDPAHRQRMIELIQEIRDKGEVRLVLSSHLLRDVEQCCDQVLVLHEGRVAGQCDLAAERRVQPRLLELETAGDGAAFAQALADIGCECAAAGKHRIKLVMPEGLSVRDLYRVAAEREVQLRRIEVKRTSLEEIFLAAVGEMNGRL